MALFYGERYKPKNFKDLLNRYGYDISTMIFMVLFNIFIFPFHSLMIKILASISTIPEFVVLSLAVIFMTYFFYIMVFWAIALLHACAISLWDTYKSHL